MKMETAYFARAAELSPAEIPLQTRLEPEPCRKDRLFISDLSDLYVQFYRFQVELRGQKESFLKTKENLMLTSIISGNLGSLLSQESNSKKRQPVFEYHKFCFQVARYLLLVPYTHLRQIFQKKYLSNMKIPKIIMGTYSAISQATDVFNNFLFDLNFLSQIRTNFFATDLAALYIQLADEFVDSGKSSLQPQKTLALLRLHWLEVFGESSKMPFPRGIDNFFFEEGVSLDLIKTKYGISCQEVLDILHKLSDEIWRLLKTMDKTRSEAFLEKFRLMIEQSFSTFYEELVYTIDPLLISDIDNKAILEHYERKTSSVMAAWLELRAINAAVPLNSRTKEIRQWARLFFDFQIFDDLKDIKQDYGVQLNLLQIVSEKYVDEANWLSKNVQGFVVDGEINKTLEINLMMPCSVAHLKLISNINGNAYFTPLLKLIQNYRWKKSWLSSHLSFQKKGAALNIEKHYLAENLFFYVKNPLARSSVFIIVFALSLYEASESLDLYFSHCLDVLALDDKAYVYLHSSLKNFFNYLVFAPTMSLKNKSQLFHEVLCRSGQLDTVISVLQNLCIDKPKLQDVVLKLKEFKNG